MLRTIVVALALSAPIALRQVPRFEAVQPDLLALGGSFTNAWADFDGDGDLDIFVGFNGTANRLYRNDAGTLVDVAAAAGVADTRATRATAWGDFDADGDPDLLLGFAPGAGSVLRLYRNDAGKFSDATPAAGLEVAMGAVRQPSWIDIDADGDLDLFIAFRDKANALYRNDSGKFTDIAASIGLADTRRTVGAVWFDYDQDGDIDLYAGNMDGDANALFRNDGGRFTDVAEQTGVAWGGRTPRDATNGTVRPCAADVNNDGRPDLFMANYGRNGLFLNTAAGFVDVSTTWGIAIDSRYDSCTFADFDNDGRIDLYVNGTVTGGTSYRDYLFRNTGTAFEDVTPENIQSLQSDHGVAWADFDGDGDEDLALTGSRADGMHSLLRNTLAASAQRGSIRVRVVDAPGRSTRAGTEVRVYAPGTRTLLGMRIVDTGSGYDAQNDIPIHIAVGAASTVDVEVIYPAAGRRVTVVSRGVNTREGGRSALVTMRVPTGTP